MKSKSKQQIKKNNLRLILFGGNRKNENGPFVTAFLEAKRLGFEIIVLTDHVHLAMPAKNNTFQQLLEENNAQWYSFKKINSKIIKKFITKNSFGLSVNSIWIFNQEIINLFNGRFYNYHGSRLPQGRGAGTYSWKILMENYEGGLTIHQVEAKIDVGNIIKQHKFNFPKTCKVSADYYKYMEKIEPKFFGQFFDSLLKNSIFKLKKQSHKDSSYWPRLDTYMHGLINWAWSAKEIELFVKAFSDPHPGASTYINGEKFFFKKCVFKKSHYKFHPFQAGLVFRKFNNKLFVATTDGSLEVSELINKNGDDVIPKIKLGHRFFTPQSELEKSLTTKSIVK